MNRTFTRVFFHLYIKRNHIIPRHFCLSTARQISVLRSYCFQMQNLRMGQNTGDNDDGGGNRSLDVSPESESGLQTIPRVETPKMYVVVLLNDDYTPMDFVVLVLRRFFAKSEEEAHKIMLDVHKKGAGTAGVYTLEVAEMKVMQVNQFSQLNHHPLKSTLQEA
jgi:ATP-dependent Clp protease adaptor protein ClpS